MKIFLVQTAFTERTNNERTVKRNKLCIELKLTNHAKASINT